MTQSSPPPAMVSKTGRFRLSPDGDRIILQAEWKGIWGWQQKFQSARWLDATPQDLADLVSIEVVPAKIAVEAA